MAAHPELVRQVTELFETRRKRQQSRIVVQGELVVQRQQDINEISARIRNGRKSLALLEEQIAISEELLKDALTNRLKHLDLLKDQAHIKGRLEEDSAAVQRSHSALKEAKFELQRLRSAFGEEVRQELEEKRQRLKELNQRLHKYADSFDRTVLRSPVEGVVKQLHVFTRGGVLQPGATVAEIVPGEDKLVIEAKLPIQDIGYIERGQVARIKLASSDATRFGAIEGRVTAWSAPTPL